MEQQRSKEWYSVRLGKFTASEIHKLLGVKGLGLTGENYIFEKATEIVFGIDEEENFVSSDMKRGIELEPIAFRKFQELKDLEFIEVKESYFFPYGEDAGASPDGVVGKNAVLEIKCPRFEKFCKYIKNGINEIDNVYMAQMQMQMLCSNSEKAHFFNYAIHKGQEMWHEIEVPRDEKIISLIKERLEVAIKMRNEFVEYLIKNKQF